MDGGTHGWIYPVSGIGCVAAGPPAWSLANPRSNKAEGEGCHCPYEQKIVLSIGVTTRNLGACLAPLLSVPDMDQRATLMIVLALFVMVIVTLLGTKWLGRPVTTS